MITLVTTDTGWIKGPENDPLDQCAHGRIAFQIDDTVFVEPEYGRLTISAAALFLLRTLEHDHTEESPVAESNLLFPCCGFTVWPAGQRFKVLCMGCRNGVDVDIVHEHGHVLISNRKGVTKTITRTEWRDAVLEFAHQVTAVYAQYPERCIPGDDYDREGWQLFWEEWRSRVKTAGGG